MPGIVRVFELTGAIGVPLGGVATADAVFTIDPASRSAWVTVWVPLQVVEAPTTNEVAKQVMPVALGSETLSAVRATLPVFATENEYGIVAFNDEKEVVVEVFVIDRPGRNTRGTTTVFDDVGAMVVPPGVVPTTEAVLVTFAATTSAAVVV